MKRAPWLIAAAAVLGFSAPANAPAEVLVVPIVDEINYVQRAFVRRCVERARLEKPKLVLIDMDTPGGDVGATLAICEDLLSLGKSGIRTAVLIKRTESGDWAAGAAASAGALISLACQRIYMSTGTVIGAAQPVTMDPEEGMKAAPRKIVSFLREKIAAIAKQNGYPEHLAMAMVDPEHEVYRIVAAGKVSFVDAEEKTKIVDANVGDIDVKTVTKKGEPLTLTSDRAVEFGIATKAESIGEVLSKEGLAGASQAVEGFSWSETLAGFVTSGPVQSLLMLLVILCVYMEGKTQTMGVFAGVAAVSLALFFFGHYIAGLAGILEFVLIVIGFALIAVEIFLVPGTMVSAIIGSILIFTGLIMLMTPVTIPDVENPFEVDSLTAAGAHVVLTFMVATGIFLVLVRFMKQIPMLNRLVLQAEIAGTAPAPTMLPSTSRLVGSVGTVVSRLAPGGKIEVEGGDIVDVVSDGDFIEAGRRVRVVAVDGPRVVVRPE